MITSLDKNTALILIDLQRGIVNTPKAHPVAGILENAAKLTEAFRNANLPIVVTNVNAAGAAWTRSRKDQRMPVGAYKDDFLDITHEIKTEPGDIIITKHTWGAFFETTLREQLQERGVTGIVLGGVSTSIGIEGTARQAMEYGYNVSFALDAMTDNVAEAHNNSIMHIFPRIGEVGTTDEIIAKLIS
ncbi:isochorismatase family protein [Mucilaginibacter myungsuensis]|uniref:Isochorismatase family protein n=1 Tax=Mucilaginibacter myungsuensis TaxID=649104 RepID=A0A929KTW9_9SPHI|nr:isochorismatase family protein [Mucilaginibacter myungsuensis]MBE9661107.1 isochorismatase family protein [Mucilaginibacter myungsuensis]MDN3597251.1 isochorismatase family protein [Mucilaginibacter myungsuensis]